MQKNNVDKKTLFGLFYKYQGVKNGTCKSNSQNEHGLIVECKLTPQTIKELMVKNRVSVRELSGGKK